MHFSEKVIARFLLIILFSYFTYNLLTEQTPWILLDTANLVFHEAGHLIFLPFGQFISLLGGSLNQILFPIIFMTYFLLKKELFSATAILFWVGESIVNVSIYMKDAQEMRLPLLIEGTIHDWNWIFTYLHLLPQAKIIGSTIYIFGIFLIFLSLVGLLTLTSIQSQEVKK